MGNAERLITLTRVLEKIQHLSIQAQRNLLLNRIDAHPGAVYFIIYRKTVSVDQAANAALAPRRFRAKNCY